MEAGLVLLFVQVLDVFIPVCEHSAFYRFLVNKHIFFLFCLPPGFFPVLGPTERWLLRHLAQPCFVCSRAGSDMCLLSKNSTVHRDWDRTIGVCSFVVVIFVEYWETPVYTSASQAVLNSVLLSHGDTSTQNTMIANHENKYWTDLFFVRHPLPGFELRSPRPRTNKLDRSAMGPAYLTSTYSVDKCKLNTKRSDCKIPDHNAHFRTSHIFVAALWSHINRYWMQASIWLLQSRFCNKSNGKCWIKTPKDTGPLDWNQMTK